jgi:methylenetetrahydrofolate reductase (NADPH)
VHASELVQLVRATHGAHFCIGVAGHPEGHPDSPDSASDIRHLQEKVNCGADFILTQLFYDTGAFFRFVRQCRGAGIHCPIIPGIMPIQSAATFHAITEGACVAVPPAVMASLAPIAHDATAVRDYGVRLGTAMCEEILASKLCPGIHFYTLNLEKSVRKILSATRLVAADGVQSLATRKLPWRPSALARRAAEGVRPIYWANRPKSYIQRTDSWDRYANGRWGGADSPAFGEFSESDILGAQWGSAAERRAMWGDALLTVQEVYNVFALYVGGLVPKLPWCETALLLETGVIQQQLSDMNKAGFMTINSQVRCNRCWRTRLATPAGSTQSQASHPPALVHACGRSLDLTACRPRILPLAGARR